MAAQPYDPSVILIIPPSPTVLALVAALPRNYASVPSPFTQPPNDPRSNVGNGTSAPSKDVTVSCKGYQFLFPEYTVGLRLSEEYDGPLAAIDMDAPDGLTDYQFDQLESWTWVVATPLTLSATLGGMVIRLPHTLPSSRGRTQGSTQGSACWGRSNSRSWTPALPGFSQRICSRTNSTAKWGRRASAETGSGE